MTSGCSHISFQQPAAPPPSPFPAGGALPSTSCSISFISSSLSLSPIVHMMIRSSVTETQPSPSRGGGGTATNVFVCQMIGPLGGWGQSHPQVGPQGALTTTTLRLSSSSRGGVTAWMVKFCLFKKMKKNNFHKTTHYIFQSSLNLTERVR